MSAAFTQGWDAEAAGKPKEAPRELTAEQRRWWLQGFDARRDWWKKRIIGKERKKP